MATKKLGKDLIRDPERGLVPGRNQGRLDETYGKFLTALEPEREEVQIALACADDPRFRSFLGMMGRKVGNRVVSLQANAIACGISLKEFREWANSSAAQEIMAVAIRRAPRITERIADQAEEIVEFCERCDGTGQITASLDQMEAPGYRQVGFDAEERPLFVRDCPHGTDGKIRRLGSEHAQDRILEIAGVINRKGAGVTLIQNFGSAGHMSAVGSLSSMTIDAESEQV